MMILINDWRVWMFLGLLVILSLAILVLLSITYQMVCMLFARFSAGFVQQKNDVTLLHKILEEMLQWMQATDTHLTKSLKNDEQNDREIERRLQASRERERTLLKKTGDILKRVAAGDEVKKQEIRSVTTEIETVDQQ
jgi:biopolymer transport protein ExbB/TolQ